MTLLSLTGFFALLFLLYRNETKFPYFLFLTWLSKISNHDIVSVSSLTGKCTARKLKNFCSSSLWTFLHHMVILRSQNKINGFFMILARPFELDRLLCVIIFSLPGVRKEEAFILPFSTITINLIIMCSCSLLEQCLSPRFGKLRTNASHQSQHLTILTISWSVVGRFPIYPPVAINCKPSKDISA